MNKGKAKRLRKELEQEQRAADVGYNRAARMLRPVLLTPDQKRDLLKLKPATLTQMAAGGDLGAPVHTHEEQQHGPR